MKIFIGDMCPVFRHGFILQETSVADWRATVDRFLAEDAIYPGIRVTFLPFSAHLYQQGLDTFSRGLDLWLTR